MDLSNIFDEGNESTPTVNGEESIFAETPQVDSAEETKAVESTGEVKPVAEEAAEGEEVSGAGDDTGKSEEISEEISDEEIQKSQDEAEKRLADPNSPKWFKNYVKNVYEPNLAKKDEALTVYEPLKDYGDVPRIVENLEMLKGLEAFETNPKTGLPEPTVKPFVSKLIETKGLKTAVDVILELGKVADPAKPDETLMHRFIESFGLNPNRLADYKKFADNGYQLANGGSIPPSAEELEQIPEHLREAYASLSPDDRDELQLMSENLQQTTLKALQHELDTKRQAQEREQSDAEKAATEKIQAEQKFYRDIAIKTEAVQIEGGAQLHSAFVESLVNTGLDTFDVINIANTMSVILNGSGAEAKASLAALEEIGVTLDPAIKTLYGEWQGAANAVATFEVQGDQANYEKAVNRFNDLTERLERKSQPISAAIFAHRSKTNAKRIESRNEAIDKSQHNKNGVAPKEGVPATILPNGSVPVRSYSDSEYAQIAAFK